MMKMMMTLSKNGKYLIKGFQSPSIFHQKEYDLIIVGGFWYDDYIPSFKIWQKIVVIEDRYIGSGEIGHTIAHTTHVLDDRY
jgi:hypothetical protein